jgi:hypothetical protein
MHSVNPYITDGTTFINPAGLVFTLLMGLLVMVLPRRWAMLPVVALTCYMTMGIRLMVFGMNFTMMRVLLLFGWARIVFRGELWRINLNPLDKTVFFSAITGIVPSVLLWQTYDALKWRLGGAYDTLGFYFLFRLLIRDKEEAIRVLKMFAVLIVPLAGCMLLERATGRNPFGALGGVPEITLIRDNALRCQGPFAHPILSGTFGATLMPLFVGLWGYQKQKPILAILAILSTAVITVTSASSGPVLIYMIAILALALWPFRLKMRTLRWAIVVALGGLQIVMKAPVYYLMARVDVFSGSTGYHRALLIDRAIHNFWDWWLIGTKSTANWASQNDHLFDITNQYILAGVNGGLIAMILLIAVIVLGFKALGRSVRMTEGRGQKRDVWLLWALGAALFAHAATFLSVSYFDQNFVNWSLLVALISTCAGSSLLLPRAEFLAKLSDQTSEERESAPSHVLAPLQRSFKKEPDPKFKTKTWPKTRPTF